MDYVSIYDKVSGKILRHMTNFKGIRKLSLDTDEVGLVDGRHDPDTTYIVGGSVTVRPESQCSIDKIMIAADGVGQSVVLGIPAGSSLTVNGIDYGEVNDGQVEITSDVPGALVVVLSLFPYLDYEVTINAS